MSHDDKRSNTCSLTQRYPIAAMTRPNFGRMKPKLRDIAIHTAVEADFDAVVALNLAAVDYTSPLNKTRLRHLNAISCYHKVVAIEGRIAAFLLVMKHGCGYLNENFEWFSSRFEQFLYVDRIVVDSRYHGLGLGTQLYKDLFLFARSNRIPVITCEYNVSPLNEPSRIFHDKFDFRELGRQWLGEGSKQVSLQMAEI